MSDHSPRHVAELAALMDGTLQGEGQLVIRNAATSDAAGPEEISFISADDKNLSRLKGCKAGCVVIATAAAEKIPPGFPGSVILVADPALAFQKILPLFRPPVPFAKREISPQAIISPTAKIGANCHIGPNVVICDGTVIAADCTIHAGAYIAENCTIGSHTVIHPNAVLYYGTKVGQRSIIHANAVIGADGFGYRFTAGRFEKIPQLGHVEIGDDVEIGACTTVDRGAIGPTTIGDGTKIDNLVMVAHNCRIGKHNVFASQVGLAGSCTTGDYVRLAGQVGIRDHVTLNTGCSVGAKSGVPCDIPAGEFWVGLPATHESEQKRLIFTLRRAPEMREQIRALQKQLNEVSAQLAALNKTEDVPPNRESLRQAG